MTAEAADILAQVEVDLRRLGLEGVPIADPVPLALEAARYALSCRSERQAFLVDSGKMSPAIAAAVDAGARCPPNASDFQRGLTFGLALALAGKLA